MLNGHFLFIFLHVYFVLHMPYVLYIIHLYVFSNKKYFETIQITNYVSA